MRQNLTSSKYYTATRIVVNAVILFAIAMDGFSQNPLLGIGNKICDMNDGMNSIPTENLPTPDICCGLDASYFYNGTVSSKNQTVQFDKNGELLFFIVDGIIYDRDGYLIADAGNCEENECYPCLWNQSHQIISTPFPEKCDRFIIIRNKGSQLLFSFLDFTLPNCHFPGSKLGALISSSDIDSGFFPELSFYNTSNGNVEKYGKYSFIFHPFDAIKLGVMHFDLLEKANNSSKILFIVHQGEFAIIKINTSGLNLSQSYSFNSGTYERLEEGECEIGFDQINGEYLIAFPTAECPFYDPDLPSNFHNNLVIARIDTNGMIINVDGYQTSFIPTPNTTSNAIAGLEFSPNGQYLYFSQHRDPIIGYISLNDGNAHGMPYSISNLNNYDNTRIEGNKTPDGSNDAIYFLGDDNTLAGIYDVNHPSTSLWIPNVSTTINIGTFPSHYSYQAEESNFNSIQTQAFNAAEIIDFFSTSTCCTDQANIIDFQGLIVNTTTDGLWSYDNNPFDNSIIPVRIVDDLIFPTGTSTTITNMIFEFDEDADVIIEKGAYVRLDGTTFTALSCGGMMWPGINLLGTTNASFNIDQNPPINGDQGYLYMNNSTIEHALKAVEVGTNQTNAGGIIRAYNSTFRNNQYGVVFKKFHCINIAGNFLQNKSVFNNCTFITDAHLNHPNLAPVFHAWLTTVDKINFTNCSFMNTTPLSVYNWKERGTGIYAYQASFMVDGNNDPWDGNLGDLDQTTFYKLQYGIKSFGFNNPLAFYTCKQQEFQYCLYGIVNKNTDNVQLYQNNFVLPDADGFSTNASMERGIYLSNSTGFVVEQNQFMGSNDPLVQEDYPNALGIWVDNSGDFSNEIRNNDFNEMRLGTYVTRENQDFVSGVNGTFDPEPLSDQIGLQLFCNTYTNGQTDVYRDQNTTMRWVQGGNQGNGNSNQISGNRFSVDDCLGTVSYWVNDPYNVEHLFYVCHNQPNTIPDCAGSTSTHPDGNEVILMTNSIDFSNPYDETDCPNTYGGGGGQTPGGIGGIIAQLNTVKVELQSAKYTYNTVVDNNQKQSTIDLLNEAFPHESQYYRDLLIQRFPLSDEVMRQLIAQASRLSPWHLTEVFLANSALRKEMIAEIERAEILSPFFMAFLYDADAGASLRTLMELNIMGLATHRDKLIQQVAQAGLTYESNPELETDQLIYLNEYIDEINQSDALVMLRSRASLLASKQDYAGAIAPVLSEPKLANFKKIIEMEQAVAGDWSLLDSTQINELWMIYENPTDWSNTMALGILQEIGLADFEPEPRVPIQYRSLQIGKDKRNEELPLLGVWPNPASGSAWLHYPIEADGNATIQVYDPQGRLMNSFQPNTHGLVELSLKNYESGIYIVQLIAFDKVVESIKLNVVNQ